MKLITSKRDSDKTKTLIKHSIDNGIPILTLSAEDAASIRLEAITSFGREVDIITPNDLAQITYTGEILVDDLEKSFTTLLEDYVRSSSFTIAAATVKEE